MIMTAHQRPSIVELRSLPYNPRLRKGQAYWNRAAELWPDLVEPLSGSDVDPFYDSKRLLLFVAKLREILGEPITPENRLTL